MNWLAHLVLSEPAPAFRVGNLLADLLPIGELRQLPEAFQRGVARHRAIDSFTDKHPIFRRSVARLDTRYRRYGGVVMDIFYDHLLTANWRHYQTDELRNFVATFHADVESCRADIPQDAYRILQRMRTGEWLTSYGDVAGVRITLERIAQRLRRPFDLGGAAAELDRHYPALGADFDEFFPLITASFPTAGDANRLD